jgi:hypothetical protein
MAKNSKPTITPIATFFIFQSSFFVFPVHIYEWEMLIYRLKTSVVKRCWFIISPLS